MQRQIDLFLEFMINDKDGSVNTIAAYRNDLGQLMSFTKDQRKMQGKVIRSWSTLTAEDVGSYLTYLTDDRDYATSTIARKLAAAKSFLQYLLSVGTIKSDPSEKIDPPKVEKSSPRTITLQEIVKLLAEPAKSTTPKALRDKSILELLYASGMRVTELVNLDLEDIDLSQATVVCGVDGKRQRTIKIPKDVVEYLQKYLEQGRSTTAVLHDESALFLNHRGRRLTRQGLWLIIKGYVETVGIKGNVTPHTLRHSFASHLLNTGAGLKELQERLGHANINTTQVYRHDNSAVIIDGKEIAPRKRNNE